MKVRYVAGNELHATKGNGIWDKLIPMTGLPGFYGLEQYFEEGSVIDSIEILNNTRAISISSNKNITVNKIIATNNNKSIYECRFRGLTIKSAIIRNLYMRLVGCDIETIEYNGSKIYLDGCQVGTLIELDGSRLGDAKNTKIGTYYIDSTKMFDCNWLTSIGKIINIADKRKLKSLAEICIESLNNQEESLVKYISNTGHCIPSHLQRFCKCSICGVVRMRLFMKQYSNIHRLYLTPSMLVGYRCGDELLCQERKEKNVKEIENGSAYWFKAMNYIGNDRNRITKDEMINACRRLGIIAPSSCFLRAELNKFAFIAYRCYPQMPRLDEESDDVVFGIEDLVSGRRSFSTIFKNSLGFHIRKLKD